MAAVISNQGGFYSPLAYLSEARRMGLRVLPPDINASEKPYTGAERSIRVGLMQIQGLSQRALEQLLQEQRRCGSFGSFQNFLDRLRLEPSDVRLLIKAGCFDTLEGKKARPRLLWELLERQNSIRRPAKTGSLFEQFRTELPSPPAYDDATVLRQEIETLGMLVSCHPLTPHRRALTGLKRIEAVELNRWVGRYVTLVGWWVTGKVVQTHLGQPMEFITFEDSSALFDTTFFPRAYARFCRRLSRQRPYVLKGKVEEDFGVATVNVEWIEFLDQR